MSRERDTGFFSLGGIVHYLALLFVITPAVDFVANVAPLHPSDVHWRYGSVGLLSGFLLTPMLGLLLSTIAAAWLEQSRMQWFLAFVNLVGGVLLLAALAFYGLDLLEVRHGVPPDARTTFDIGSLKAFAKHLVTVPALLWLGWVNLRLVRERQRGQAARPGDALIASRLRSKSSSGQS